MLSELFWIVPVCSAIALGFAWFFFKQVMKETEGTDQMIKIAAYVREGAMAYLKQQYKIVIVFFIIITIVMMNRICFS